MKKNPVALQTQDFALQLAKLREAREISACAMSYDLGHNRSYINGIELQKYLPSFTEFIEICNYLNATPNDLFLSSFGFGFPSGYFAIQASDSTASPV